LASVVFLAPDPAELPFHNLWEETTLPGTTFDPLTGAQKADVAIVGAGVAGLSTALHLAEAGVSVAVLEANLVGSGATGKSGGLLAPDMIRHTPSQLEQLLGRERGSRVIRLIGSSAAQCFELIDKHALACESERNAFWVPAHDDASASALENRAQEWRERGFNVSYSRADETAWALGTNRYRSAIRYGDGGTLNPLAFSRGLARAARGFGANIFEYSPVLTLNRCAAGWRLETRQGVLEADRVVLAANGGNAKLHPMLDRTVLPLDVIEYASAPLSPELQSEILRDRVAFTDKQAYIFTARYDAAGRLIAAFPDFMIKRSNSALVAEAADRLAFYFPALRNISIEYMWQGRAWINPDLLPKIYKLGDGAFAIQACNGRGLTTNTVLGKEMAAALYYNDPALLSIIPQTPSPIRFYRTAQHFPSLLMLSAFIRNRRSRNK